MKKPKKKPPRAGFALHYARATMLLDRMERPKATAAALMRAGDISRAQLFRVLRVMREMGAKFTHGDEGYTLESRGPFV